MGNNNSVDKNIIIYVVQWLDVPHVVAFSLVSKRLQQILANHIKVLEWKHSQLDKKIWLVSSVGWEKSVIVFLAKGADPNEGIKGAAAGGHMDIVKLLLDKGADPNEAIESAAAYGYMDIVKLCLEKGADPNAGIRGASENGHMDIIEFLETL